MTMTPGDGVSRSEWYMQQLRADPEKWERFNRVRPDPGVPDDMADIERLLLDPSDEGTQ